MNIRKHGIASAVAMLAFIILSLMSGPLGMPVLYALLAVGLASTVLYFHYRRRAARAEAIPRPVLPLGMPDDDEITADIKAAVAVRDGGVCQIKAPCCIVDRKVQYDHIIPRSWGGPTTFENIQFACGPCNRFKSNHWAGTYANQMTRDQVSKMLV